MPWRECDAVSERRQMIDLYESRGFTKSELAEHFGVSRPTVYRWLSRYREEGEGGLEDRSRRPHTSPLATPEGLIQEILGVRRKYRDWGPVTIAGYLRRTQPDKPWPAASTMGEILARHGLVKKRRRRRKVRHPGRPIVPMDVANATWAVDFKGEFKTRDGRYCYPLTITDGFSRYVLGCRARFSTRTEEARPVFEQTFRRYGLPRQILSDSGPPFGSTALAGLSRLSVWWIRLGIQPVRIEPGRPDQNGRHERFHRTLGVATRPPSAHLRAQQRRFDRFRHTFNHERPHHALDMETPAERYCRSPRPYPSRLPELEYERHFEVRKVDAAGRISWRDRPLRVSKTLRGELVAFETVDDGAHRVYFGPVLLGVFDESSWRILD